MPWWCANSWAVGKRCQPQPKLPLDEGWIPSGWTELLALGEKMLSYSAGPDPGESTSAHTKKMLVLRAQVTLVVTDMGLLNGMGWISLTQKPCAHDPLVKNLFLAPNLTLPLVQLHAIPSDPVTVTTEQRSASAPALLS